MRYMPGSRRLRCRFSLVLIISLGAREAECLTRLFRRYHDTEPLWTAYPNATTEPLGPECSFYENELRLPHGTVPATPAGPAVEFPRGRGQKMYAGMLMWSSGGNLDHRRATMAMLGDESVYYETPMFSAYRLMALGRFHEINSILRRNTGCWGDWKASERHGFDWFYAAATARAFSTEYMEHFPRAANEAEASELARVLIDDVFIEQADTVMMQQLRLHDPYFLLWTMLCYRKASYIYGRTYPEEGFRETGPVGTSLGRMLVLSVDARVRAIDTNLNNLHNWWHDEHGAAAQLDEEELRRALVELFPDACCCDDNDFTEMLLPGYAPPSHIEGIEYSPYHHFYRVAGGGGGSGDGDGSGSNGGSDLAGGPAYVAVLRAVGRCVTQPDPDGPFFFCQEEDCTEDRDTYCGITPIFIEEPMERVPVVALIYSTPALSEFDCDAAQGTAAVAAAAAAAAAAAEQAREAFWRLNGGKSPAAIESGAPLPPPDLLVGLQGLRFALPRGRRVRAVMARTGHVGTTGSAGAADIADDSTISDVLLDLWDDEKRPAAARVLEARGEAGSPLL